jgi:DNA-binding NarL/FixJ family response regulator
MLQHAPSALTPPLVAGAVPQAGLMSWRHGLQAPSAEGPQDAVSRRRVLIADDHALLRVGLQALLSADHGDIEIDEASCLQDAIEVYRAHPDIDLVLLDLNMGDCRGLQGLCQFKQRFPEARVAVFSATQDEFVIRQAQALGAVAYIAKAYEPAAMSQMIVSLLRSEPGSSSLSGFPGLTRSASYDRVAELGQRHLEILDLVLFGCSNQEISTATHLSLGTVKNYVSIILLALDVKSRSHLISLFR